MKLVYSYSFSLLLIIPLLSSLPVVALGDILQFPHVEAEFVTEREGVTPGIAAEVALRIKPEAGWHLYWRNSGDSGASPKLTWKVED
ncbi:MAG: hypothetical protein KDD60_08125, partial [Bdellovibrionales bacterium]|nr:hypothetical protein [Bdellovibrionales bacterium]